MYIYRYRKKYKYMRSIVSYYIITNNRPKYAGANKVYGNICQYMSDKLSMMPGQIACKFKMRRVPTLHATNTRYNRIL